ncbi:uncharacterized protein LOC125229116 [Leguminivora glycinivorella]|uniref:uncharacterized protein LOC125229116 n=1 Tax=Leguminivora glycinivorella TaxID=1035111 RepID=UPI00200C131A|nr:uncharacterized protein LOC125229116 [Leguminivora glycinivorella]
MDVTSLAAALTDALQANRSNRKYLPDLPSFSGQCAEWLQFKAAYNESAPSFANSENVARIRKSLKGAALEAVSALLISQPRPDDIIKALERRYGRPDALLLNEMERIKALPRLAESPRDLCTFAGRIANAVTTIEILKKPQYLHNPELLRSIVEKLTPILKSKWYDYAASDEDTPELKKIADFLNNEADKCTPYAPPETIAEPKEARATKKKPERTCVAVAEVKKTKEEKLPCPVCDQSAHQLPTCPQFTKLGTNERWEIAKKHNMCYRCLVSKHRRFVCRAKPCGHQGCAMRHHKLLHHEKAPTDTVAASNEPTQPRKSDEVVAIAVKQAVHAATRASRAYLKMAPVLLRGPHSEVATFALLDEGSTVTIIDSAIAAALNLDGPTEPMWVQGVGGNEMAYEKSKRVDVRIRNKHGGDEQLVTNAHTVGRLDFTTQTISEREIDDCEHLRDIKHLLTYEDATPGILLGQDNWELVVSRKLKKGRRDQPVASKTLLGWVLHGCRHSQAIPVAHCCAHLTRIQPGGNIENEMKNFFALESLSIEPRKPRSDPEQQALKTLEEKSRRLPDGRFETGLLWRQEDINIPDNRADALKRLHTLEKKLDRDADLKKQYTERVDNLLVSAYAELAPTPSSGKTWYLPHFAVRNPEKPKIRLVHDAAATSHGRSLNDMLLAGPDLLQSLPGVIMRFRQYGVAVSADIKEMFMQIKIREEDRDALRFLWRGDRREGGPTEYRMTSVIFGASSSPCTALYIKNRNAREHAARHPEAARAIERNHYMDDYLQSFPSIEEAKRVSSEVNHVHKKARFELRGWATNEPEVIGKKEREGVTVSIGGSEIEKTLGLLWDTREDSIRFKLNTRRAPPEVIKGQRPPTKREALSIIMSIFDPLGLISPVTTPAKRIMQDTWRYTTAWDEEIPEELRERWGNWLQHLRDLGDLSIPRCYDIAPAPKYELHTFVDASEEAYAAAVYWRMTRADGTTKVALAAAKSRVTPTRLVSIPRLELQAAVLGVRLAEAVGNEHDFEINSRTYWSDARTALAWIRSEPRTYKSFVAHRLAEIEDYTKKDEWRWVPSAHNVADDATRAAPSDFDTRHRWFTGPAFLYEPEEAWPQENKMKIEPTGEEKEVCCSVATPRKSRAAVPAIENFSKWTSLLRTAARVLQFIDLLRERQKSRASLATQCIAAARRKRTRANKDGDSTWGKRDKRAPVVPKTVENSRRRKYIILEARYLLAAEKVLVRTSQEDSYARERKRIAEGLAPNKDDRLAKLSVYLDEDDIIRQRGRIAAADDISEDAVHPIVLCGKHHYTYLYVSHVHERLHHGGTETVVNELRQRVYIPKIRPAVKKVIARCPECRLRKAKPAGPPTGDLPAARLGHHLRPFTYTGLDYFGPLEVTVGRHREKRYVALFTCMTSRAIHLEVAASLTTDSAINALRRFIARRGCPTELWSDNGTAFKGANRELTEAMREAAHARRINWRFLPPPHPSWLVCGREW